MSFNIYKPNLSVLQAICRQYVIPTIRTCALLSTGGERGPCLPHVSDLSALKIFLQYALACWGYIKGLWCAPHGAIARRNLLKPNVESHWILGGTLRITNFTPEIWARTGLVLDLWLEQKKEHFHVKSHPDMQAHSLSIQIQVKHKQWQSGWCLSLHIYPLCCKYLHRKEKEIQCLHRRQQRERERRITNV